MLFCDCITVHNCSDLRNTNTCNHTGSTDRARSDTNLDSIHASLDESFGCFAGCYITCDDLQIRISFLDHSDTAQYILRMSMSRIENNHIHMSLNQCADTV